MAIGEAHLRATYSKVRRQIDNYPNLTRDKLYSILSFFFFSAILQFLIVRIPSLLATTSRMCSAATAACRRACPRRQAPSRGILASVRGQELIISRLHIYIYIHTYFTGLSKLRLVNCRPLDCVLWRQSRDHRWWHRPLLHGGRLYEVLILIIHYFFHFYIFVVVSRYESYGWHVQTVHDANDLHALRAATRIAQQVTDRPSIIKARDTSLLFKLICLCYFYY